MLASPCVDLVLLQEVMGDPGTVDLEFFVLKNGTWSNGLQSSQYQRL